MVGWQARPGGEVLWPDWFSCNPGGADIQSWFRQNRRALLWPRSGLLRHFSEDQGQTWPQQVNGGTACGTCKGPAFLKTGPTSVFNCPRRVPDGSFSVQPSGTPGCNPHP